jgi:hypothetical protein
MRRLLPLLLPVAALAAAPAAADQRIDPETRLARAVEGRVAGAPVDCISLHTVRSSRMIDDTAIIFDAGHTLYVNRPRAGAETLASHDTLVTRTFSNRLCSIDVVEVVDGATLGFSRPVFLGEFVPYRRAR